MRNLAAAVFGALVFVTSNVPVSAQELWPQACPTDFVARATNAGLKDASAWPAACFLECPKRGTGELISDPSVAADRCFAAVHFRVPSSDNLGERDTRQRDINLDGAPERLEIRGTAIYVFEPTDAGGIYIGQLNAHPTFFVARDSDEELVILNLMRLGAGEVYLQYIEYADQEFRVVREDRIQ